MKRCTLDKRSLISPNVCHRADLERKKEESSGLAIQDAAAPARIPLDVTLKL